MEDKNNWGEKQIVYVVYYTGRYNILVTLNLDQCCRFALNVTIRISRPFIVYIYFI